MNLGLLAHGLALPSGARGEPVLVDHFEVTERCTSKTLNSTMTKRFAYTPVFLFCFGFDFTPASGVL